MPSMSRARRTPLATQEARFAGAQQDRLEELASLGDPGPVAIGEQVVQGAAFEIRRQQARESLGRQVDLFEEQRLAVGQAQSLEVERRRARARGRAPRRRPRRPTPVGRR